jgi:hypothetical protein
MFRSLHSDRNSGWLTFLAGGVALCKHLYDPPPAPLSDRWCLFCKISGVAISVVSLAAAVLFGFMTFEGSDSWAQFMTALLTFGLFGLPASIFVVFIPAGMVKLKLISMSVGEHLCAVLLAIAFIVQWQLLAVLLFRRSKFHSRAAMWEQLPK